MLGDNKSSLETDAGPQVSNADVSQAASTSMGDSMMSQPSVIETNKKSKNDGKLSNSVVVDYRAQKFRIILVTIGVAASAAAYVLMLFIAMPISIHLIVNMGQKGCDPEIQDDCFAATDESQRWLTLTLTLLRTMSFLMGSTIGVLSDRWGRRPMIVLALIGYGTTGLLFLIGWRVKVLGLYVFGGMLLGSCSPVTAHGIAYVSDVSRPDRLATNMGTLQGFGYFLGLLLGALISLVISQATNESGPAEGEPALQPYDELFYISYSTGFAMAAGMGLIMLFLLPESLHKDDRKNFTWKQINPFAFLALVTRSKYLACLWGSAFFGWMAVGAGESVTGGWWLRRYTQSNVNDFIIFTVLIWLGSAFGAALMTPIFVKLLGFKRAVHFTMVATISVGVGFACAETANVSYLAVGLSLLAAPVVPMQYSLIMGQADGKEKGALAGAIRSSEALAKIIGITVMGNTFANYIRVYTPDPSSCIPLDYSPTNPFNTCDCGVNTCPVYDPTNSSGRVMDASNPFVYEPSTCSLGNLSPVYDGKPSAHVAVQSPMPNPIVPQLFVDEGLVTRDGSCQGGGGLGEYDTRLLAREWCISTPAMEARGLDAAAAELWNQEFGCPGFDFSMYAEDVPKYENMEACEADLNSVDCNQTLFDETTNDPDSLNYDAEEFQSFAGVYTNITNGVSASCASLGTAEMNMCWDGVIADFAGLFPFIYFSCFGIAAYIFFIIAEVFFQKEDREFWLHKENPTATKAGVENSARDEAQESSSTSV
ncbi:Hypothetical Protein FCC1311_016952 [Hondaea fermentalgiana]|uniref:Major facilitator superfamily (MFS) profile domain-containing protein n=1 Tax=Hondaea fermentalgiana TaxID=2315210 RepID=A0A2R5G362_9STRA|nr:Hypothetical Protein FCC1311_016952 [Hondaea fermentalgiana]|eukprot:GBG25476.1 Hypothetical Protein FCC1311_016952 [Hondaea fermentalgiana]